MTRKLLTTLALAAVATAAFGATAHANVTPDGYVTVEQCSNLNGTITYAPGLRTKAKAVSAVIQGTIGGCADAFGGAYPGLGTFTATLSSPAASLANNAEVGTYVINWPVASGLNPSTGTINLSGPLSNVLGVQGSGTGGALVGTALGTSLFIVGQTGSGSRKHPVTQQTFTNTLPLKLSRNSG